MKKKWILIISVCLLSFLWIWRYQVVNSPTPSDHQTVETISISKKKWIQGEGIRFKIDDVYRSWTSDHIPQQNIVMEYQYPKEGLTTLSSHRTILDATYFYIPTIGFYLPSNSPIDPLSTKKELNAVKQGKGKITLHFPLNEEGEKVKTNGHFAIFLSKGKNKFICYDLKI